MIKRGSYAFSILTLWLATSASAQTLTEAQADSTARTLISQMTLKEKIDEMHGHGMSPFVMSMLFSKKVCPIRAGGSKRLHIPSSSFYDGPRGLFHYRGATAFPVTMARGASWDIDLEERVGEAMAEEIRALGGNYSGAVCMNVLRHPAWGRAQETYGEDPYHVGEMASALVGGIQRHHVQACAKHFAANSMENNRFGGSVNMSKRTLYEVYLPHFHKVVQRGVASIMSAYNKLNGEYCGQNKSLLSDILRDEWGFKGYVSSDWVFGLFDAQKGIEAGMNVEMPVHKVYNLHSIKKLIGQGKIREQQIDALILPTIRTKLFYASQKDFQPYPRKLVGCAEHVALAEEVAEKSAVLLKNQGLLPLDKSSMKRIAVIGSLYNVRETGDHGSSGVYPAHIVSPLEGIKAYFAGTATEILSAPVGDTARLREICLRSDVVIVIAGTSYRDEGEYIARGIIRDKANPDRKSFITRCGVLGLGGDRRYLHLHQPDIEAIHIAASVNKNVTVSLVAGSAVTVEEWQEEVPAILETFYNGMTGGTALARILFGEVNPSGKLPFIVPTSEVDLPPFDSYAPNANYGYYHGYTLLDKEKKTPRYAFGYGMSYTTFDISDINIQQTEIRTTDTIKVSVKVKNTGHRPGAEVVQLYVKFANKLKEMPDKLLRGFQKLFLKPGEERTVHFSVPASDLAFYNEATNSWEIEKTNYQILVGNSSATAGQLKGDITVR